MTRLILVRHGQTDWNAQHRYQGQTDVPLNATGQRHTTALARRLEAIAISTVYASDLQRALQTAQAVAARHGIPVQGEPRLREMAFGDWEGRTFDEIQARWPTEMADWLADPTRVSPPGGETLAQVAGRVKTVVADIIRTETDRTVLLVAHGGPLRILLCTALDMNPRAHWRFELDVASISELQVYGRDVVLTRLNDTHHVPPDRH